jgi:hypothetical protein
MSDEGLITVLTRAMRQPEFRDLLLSDPERALAGYALTPAESYRLRTLTRETFDALAKELKLGLHRTASARKGRSSAN